MISLKCPTCFNKWTYESKMMGNVNISGETLCWVCAPKAERERVIKLLLETSPSDVCDWSKPDHNSSRNVEFLEKFNEDELRKMLS